MGVFKLGKMTLGSLFKKPETIMYPQITKPQPKGLKGHIAIDAENCILCGLCDRSCTTDCISVDKAARTWSINRYQCIQCGYCTTVCPKKCLHMLPDYAPACTECQLDVVEVVESGKGAKPASSTDTGNVEKAATPSQAVEEVARAAKSAVAVSPDNTDSAKAAIDDVVLAKIALMDADKADKVRSALSC